MCLTPTSWSSASAATASSRAWRAPLKSKRPQGKDIGVEPQGTPWHDPESSAGQPQAHLDSLATVADGLAAPFVGQHNLAHVQQYVDDVVLVTDDEIVSAKGLILERCKVVAEPAASSSLAALLSGKVQVARGSTVVCVLSGDNIDAELLAALLRKR